MIAAILPFGIGGATSVCVGLAMPRGPVISAQALALWIVGVLVGFSSGPMLRSRWLMLLAPAAFARLSHTRACREPGLNEALELQVVRDGRTWD